MAKWFENNNDNTLAKSLPGILRDKGWERKLDQHRVFLDWLKLVDASVSEHARPLKIVGDVLWLEVENSAWMQQLQFQKHLLLDTLNEYLAISRFSDIRFAQAEKKWSEKSRHGGKLAYVPPSSEKIRQFEKQISCITDEEVRESLMSLWYLANACRKKET